MEFIDEVFDGLTRQQAISLCVRRAEELTASQVDFLNRAGASKKPLSAPQALRLTQLVQKLRQGDLVSAIRETQG